MFCPNCGKELLDDAVICEECGKNPTDTDVAETEAPAVNDEPVLNGEATVNDEVIAPTEKKKNGGKIIGISTVAIIILLIASISVKFFGLGAGDPSEAALNYSRATADFDINAAMKYAVVDINEMMDDMLDMQAKADGISKDKLLDDAEEELNGMGMEVEINSVADVFDAFGEAMKEQMESFGYKITDVKLSGDPVKMEKDELKDELESFALDIEDNFELKADNYIKIDKIKEGYYVTVTITTEISGEVSDSDEEIAVVKCGGKWKVLDLSLLSLF